MLAKNFRDFPKMQHFSENCWKTLLKRLAKTGKRENGGYREKGKRIRIPGKGNRQSSKFEFTAQVLEGEAALAAVRTGDAEKAALFEAWRTRGAAHEAPLGGRAR